MDDTGAVVLNRFLVRALKRESRKSGNPGETFLQLASEAVARRFLVRELSLPCWGTEQQPGQIRGRYGLLFTNGRRAAVVRMGGPSPPPAEDLLLAKCDFVLVVGLTMERSGVGGSLCGFATSRVLRALERSGMSRAPEVIPLRPPAALCQLLPHSRHPLLHLGARTLWSLVSGGPEPPSGPGNW